MFSEFSLTRCGHENTLLIKALSRVAAILLLAVLTCLPSSTRSYATDQVLQAGEAYVTRFSGTVQEGGKTVIDVNGTVAGIIDIRNPAASMLGQHWSSESQRLPVTAGQVGQVFGIALDDMSPPNVYLTATSAFGLHRTADNSDWMPGMWGSQGGPGTVWKLNKDNNYQPEIFSEITLKGRKNTGAALGNIAFDKWNKQLYVSDLETGMIHRLGQTDGKDLGAYDHGMQGRASFTDAGTGNQTSLKTVSFDTSSAVQISPCSGGDFEKTPACWNFADFRRRVWGLAVRKDESSGDVRLYYAIWGSQGFGDKAWTNAADDKGNDQSNSVWSVKIASDGSFDTTDVRREFVLPDFFKNPGLQKHGPSHPVSDIAFPMLSDQTVMLIAERGGVRNEGLDKTAPFASPHESRVLGYDLDATGIWQLKGRYDVGFYDRRKHGAPYLRANSAGGVAFGFGFAQDGNVDTSQADKTVWMTGDALCSPEGACFNPTSGQNDDYSEVYGLQATPEDAYDEAMPDGAAKSYPATGVPYPAAGPKKSIMIDADVNVDAGGNLLSQTLVRGDVTKIGDIVVYAPGEAPPVTADYPGAPIYAPGAPGAPSYAPGAPYAPGTAPGAPGAPGYAPGAPYDPGTAPGAPYDPGTAPGTPPTPPPLPDQPDLQVTKAADAATCALGGPCSYTITITNVGTGTFQGTIIINDVVEDATGQAFAGASITASAPATWTCTNMQCSLPGVALASGMSEVLNITLQLPKTVPTGPTVLSNCATVTSDTGSVSSAGNERNCAQTQIGQGTTASDLSIVKTADQTQCSPGYSCKFTITVTNNGPDKYNGKIVVVDDAPKDWAVAQDANTVCLPSAAGPKCKIDIPLPAAGLAVNASVTAGVSTTVSVNEQSGTVKNCASISQQTGSTDKIAGNDGPSCPTVTVARAPNAKLFIKKTGQYVCNPGKPCFFEITVTNVGSATYNGPLDLRDDLPKIWTGGASINLPPGFTCTQVAGTPDFDCTSSAFTLAPGKSMVLSFSTTVPPGHRTGTFTNKAKITKQLIPPGSTQLVPPATWDVFVTSNPIARDLELTKDGRKECAPGGPCEFVITITNKGMNAFTTDTGSFSFPFTVDDTLPANLTYSSVKFGHPLKDVSCTPSGAKVSCLVRGQIEPNQSASFVIVANVPNSQALGQVTNKAEIIKSIALADNNPSNNTGQHTVNIVAANPDLSIVINGTTFCTAPNCSFLKFTVSNKEKTEYKGPLDLSVDFSKAEGTRLTGVVKGGAASCPAAGWVCTKSGDGAKCHHAACRLKSGQRSQVTFNFQLDTTPANAVQKSMTKTVCGTAEWKKLPSAADKMDPDFVWSTGSRRKKTECITTTIKFPACPAGKQWNGKKCDCPSGKKQDDKTGECVDIKIPSAPIPLAAGAGALTIQKTGLTTVCNPGGKCHYDIAIMNGGTSAYVGPLTVVDTLPMGWSGTISPGSGWICMLQPKIGAPTKISCTNSSANIVLGTPEILKLNADVPNDAPPGVVKNCADLTFEPSAGGKTTITDCAKTTVAQPPDYDLALQKTLAGAGKVGGKGAFLAACNPDTPCRFLITITNKGKGTYNGPVIIKDKMPAGWVFLKAKGNWVCQQQGNYFSCGLQNQSLAPNSPPLELEVALQLPPTTTNTPKEATNYAEIDWKPAGGDSNKGNDHDEMTVQVLPGTSEITPKLMIIKTKAGGRTCDSSKGCGFTITVSNIGAGVYSGPVTILDKVFQFNGLKLAKPANAPWKCTEIALGRIKCSHPPMTLQPSPGPGKLGGTFTPLNLEFSIPEDIPGKLDSFGNCAEFRDVPTGVILENTKSCDTAKLAASYDLEVEKSGWKYCRPGNHCDWTIKITNMGRKEYIGAITLSDAADKGVEFALTGNHLEFAQENSSAKSKCVYSSKGISSFKCKINNIKVPGRTSIKVSVKSNIAAIFKHGTHLTNKASITVDGEKGYKLLDNHDSHTVEVNTFSAIIGVKKRGPPECNRSVNNDINCIFTITFENSGKGGLDPEGDRRIYVYDDWLDKYKGWNLSVLSKGWKCQFLSTIAEGRTGTWCYYTKPIPPNSSVDLKLNISAKQKSNATIKDVMENCARTESITTKEWPGFFQPGEFIPRPGKWWCHKVKIPDQIRSTTKPLTVPPSKPADLAIKKTGSAECTPGGACSYDVAVTNIGAGPYAGPIMVTDIVPKELKPSGKGGGKGWNCILKPTIGGPTTIGCQHVKQGLLPGKSVKLRIDLKVPANAQPAVVTNCARIDHSKGKGDGNPANDMSCAKTQIKAVKAPACPEGWKPFPAGAALMPDWEVKTFGSGPSAVTCMRKICPTGQQWDPVKKLCSCQQGEIWTGRNCICAWGQARDPKTGKCVAVSKPRPECPAGQRWDAIEQTCVPAPKAPPPAVLPPAPTCPAGQSWDAIEQTCVAAPTPEVVGPLLVEKCPQGEIWTGEKCICGWGQERDPKTGKCVAVSKPRPKCPAGQRWDAIEQTCVPAPKAPPPAVLPPAPTCPAGQSWDAIEQTCVAAPTPEVVGPLLVEKCPQGEIWSGEKCICGWGQERDTKTGKCVAVSKPRPECPAGQRWDAIEQTCVPPPKATPPDVVLPAPTCPAGQRWDAIEQTCVPAPKAPPPAVLPPAPTCPAGQKWNPMDQTCVPLAKPKPPTVQPCPEGQVRVRGRCVSRQIECPRGQIRRGNRCVFPPCPPGQVRRGAQCVFAPCPPGQVRKGAQCVFAPCPRGQVRRGAQCVFAPCPRGQVRRGAQCVFPPCPPGQVRRGAQCVFAPCPRGQVRRGAQCVFPPCPPGQVRRGAQCVFPPCPRGQVRRGAQCVFPPCPPGQVRRGAQCVFPPCPRGQIRRGAQCVFPPCPRGQVRRGAQCVFPPCPRGQIRRGAQCVFPPCPRGQIRRGAQCVFPPCPRGQVRRGAQCVFPPCPRGQIRRGNRCVPPPKPLKPIPKAPHLKIPGRVICPQGTEWYPPTKRCQRVVK